jgi:hypothetical protein
MHRRSAATRRTLVIALGSLTVLFVLLNFGVFLNTVFPPWTCQLKERAEVAVLEKVNADAHAEIERRPIEAEMARIEVEMRRLDEELQGLESEHVRNAMEAAREALARKGLHLKHHRLPDLEDTGALQRFEVQLEAGDVQLN